MKGAIRNVADFGIFVDLGAEVDALAHISDLCWVQTFASPAEVYQKGQEVEGIILHVDPEAERFAIGLKQLLDDPWPYLQKQYSVGAEATGKVMRVGGLGAVVELEPGVQGVVPLGETAEPLAVGATVTVKVARIEPKERRFYLQPTS